MAHGYWSLPLTRLDGQRSLAVTRAHQNCRVSSRLASKPGRGIVKEAVQAAIMAWRVVCLAGGMDIIISDRNYTGVENLMRITADIIK